MEAEYVRDRRRRRTVVLLGVLLAVLAAAAVYYLVTRQQPQTVTQKTIVVAAVAITERSVIKSTDIKTEEVPDSPALASVATDPAAVVGKVARVGIPAGAPVFPAMYGEGTIGGLAIIPEGEELTPDSPPWRAVSVTIPQERAVAGTVTSGDHIDLFATMEIKVYDPTGVTSENALLPQGYYSDFTTKVAWTNLEVLKSDAANDLYVLRVDEHQAEEIAHIQGMGAENSFTMSLRAQADARDIDRSAYGETTNRILEEYNFAIPQIIDLNTYPQPTPQPPPFVPGGPPPPTLAPVGSPTPAPGSPAPEESPTPSP
jgi:Flp pilus assembly protein CpaB